MYNFLRHIRNLKCVSSQHSICKKWSQGFKLYFWKIILKLSYQRILLSVECISRYRTMYTKNDFIGHNKLRKLCKLSKPIQDEREMLYSTSQKRYDIRATQKRDLCNNLFSTTKSVSVIIWREKQPFSHNYASV